MALSPSFVIVGTRRAAASAILDGAGNQITTLGDPSRPATATLTQPAVSTVSITLLALNTARRRFRVENKSGLANMFIAFSATATLTAYTISVTINGTYEGVLNDYTGIISAIWDAADAAGTAEVTEIAT